MRIDGDFVERFKIGSPIAEDEDEAALERYFIETGVYRALLKDELDIIAGIKGAGKTALYKMLAASGGDDAFKAIRLIAAVNPAGDPVFARLPAEGILTEAQYRELWKIYVLSLVGNDLLWWFGQPMPAAMKQLDQLLRDVDLKSDEGAKNILTKLLDRFSKGGPVKRLAIRIENDPTGGVTFMPEIEFHDHATEEPPQIVVADGALELLDAALAEAGASAWVLFDRLDEAFRDHLEAELPALRALLRTYVDFKQYKRVRLKLFIRNDLFYRVVSAQTFPALTHVSGRKREITWDAADLEDLVYRRCLTNGAALMEAGLDPADRRAVMQFFLPEQVDGLSAFDWISAKLADGTGHAAPRNVIALLREALIVQAKADARYPREQESATTLLTADSLRPAYVTLSSERLTDTVLAEADEYQRRIVEAFRGQARECTRAELCNRTGLGQDQVTSAAEGLIESGVISKSGDGYCIPELYASALNSK